MKLGELLDDLKPLNETVRKEGDRYYIFSHKTGKKIGKGAGYGSKGAAVKSMMKIASHGHFANIDKNRQNTLVKRYEKKHSK
jgi:hypothetical protein